MNSRFNKVIEQFSTLSMRERMLAVAAVIGILFLIVDFTLVRPQRADARVLRDRITAQQGEVEALDKALEALNTPSLARASDSQKRERDRMRAAIAEAELLANQAQAEVKMGDVVRTLTANVPGVQLAALRTLPSERFFTPPTVVVVAQKEVKPTDVASPAAFAPEPFRPVAPPGGEVQSIGSLPVLYKHGVEFTVAGTYASLLPYLETLEHATPGMYWGSAKLEVRQYPDATLRLTLFTFSLHPEVSFE